MNEVAVQAGGRQQAEKTADKQTQARVNDAYLCGQDLGKAEAEKEKRVPVWRVVLIAGISFLAGAGAGAIIAR